MIFATHANLAHPYHHQTWLLGSLPRWIGFATKLCQPNFYCICCAFPPRGPINLEVKIL